ncbi:hypothetical protein [Roseobacter sp. HKCCA0434]|uniref:hypothetical protein n=1 Tax=Roseobacter sp. HKCCA0434 TaxID=3079297 RepID=UPI002905DD69|nr:hypothetical protein [Roseobacter sp. HKCCA0434]
MRFLAVLLLLTGCASFGASGGEVLVAGADVLVPRANSFYAREEPLPDLLQRHARLTAVGEGAGGETGGMERLCQFGDGIPDIVLLTRSPRLTEIRRCERAGVMISADLVALYNGGIAGAPPFEQVWIAFVPARLQRNPAARRAVESLRYDFDGIIKGSDYERLFSARRT